LKYWFTSSKTKGISWRVIWQRIWPMY